MRVLIVGLIAATTSGALAGTVLGATVSWSAPVLIDHQPPLSVPPGVVPVGWSLRGWRWFGNRDLVRPCGCG